MNSEDAKKTFSSFFNLGEKFDVNYMVDLFFERTSYHTNLVKKYCNRVEKFLRKNYDFRYTYLNIHNRGEDHDLSKFEGPEIIPYILINFKHHLKNIGYDYKFSDKIEEFMSRASYYHISNNQHHPEFFENINNMSYLDISEMVADWCAMSEELGNHPRDWANKNIGTRWRFDNNKKDFIYYLIDGIY